MKLMTINTHSLIEPNYEQKLEQFVPRYSFGSGRTSWRCRR